MKNRLNLIEDIEIGYRFYFIPKLAENSNLSSYKNSYIVTKEPLGILFVDISGACQRLQLNARELEDLLCILLNDDVLTEVQEKLSSENFLKLNEIISSNAGHGLGKGVIKQLTQSLPENKHLYELDFSLIKDLSLLRDQFEKYVNVLQMLSLANSWYIEAESIANLLNDMRDTLLTNKSKELLQRSQDQANAPRVNFEFFQNLDSFLARI